MTSVFQTRDWMRRSEPEGPFTYYLRFTVAPRRGFHSNGARFNVPIAGVTVEVSEATYRAWFHRALRIPVDPCFTEPIDHNWWIDRVWDVSEHGRPVDTMIGVHGWTMGPT